MKLRIVLVAVISALVLGTSTTTAADSSTSVVALPLLNSNKPCCPGNNIFNDRSCDAGKKNTSMLLTCNGGMYLLDPTINHFDKYYITDDGHLKIDSDDAELTEDIFCTTNLRPKGKNVTRPIALVCFADSTDDELAASSIFIVKGTMAMISVVFIMATLYVYYLIPELRETQDKVTCVALSCLLMFLLLLGTMQLVILEKPFCRPVGFLTYFFSMAYFGWMNIVMLNVWKNSVMTRWRIQERTWYILNHIYGWTVPTLLSINLIVQRDYHFAAINCWFNSRRSSWLFLYLPMSLMLLLNVVLFAWSAWAIHMSGQDVSPDKKRALAYKLRLYVQLMFLAGLTWIFEVLSTFFGGPNHELSFWMLADALNALLGFCVFLVLVVWRRRIRKELAGKRILCFRAPASWADDCCSEEDGLHVSDRKILKSNSPL